jgi:type I restriction enzyme S subunit
VAGDFLEGKNGFAFASKDYKLDGKFSVLTIKNVQGDKTIDVQNLTKVDKIPLGVQEHQKLKVGDILISMTGNVGRVSMVHIENCLLNQRVGLIAPNNKIYKEFLY